MPATDSDRILAAGVPLTLADGREVRVRYSMRSLKEMEDRYGSLEEPLRLVHGLFDGSTKRHITTLVPMLAFGLLHEEGITEDGLYDLTDTTRRVEYLKVISDAIGEALPAPGKAEAEAETSLGDASTMLVTASATTANGSGE